MLKLTKNDEAPFEIPVDHGTINAALLGKLSKLRIYDKSLQNTVVAKTLISDQDSYRGISLDTLVQKSNYLECSYLLIYGKLPSLQQYNAYKMNILKHTYVHIDLRQQLETFRYNAHPTSMLISLLAATSTLHPESNPALMGESLYKTGPHENKLNAYPITSKDSSSADAGDAVCQFVRDKQVYRMVGKISTLAAAVYRHRLGRPYNEPKSDAKTYSENFLYMVDKLNELDFTPDPVLVGIIDKLFILLADDSNSCATATMRHLISSGVDPYSAVAGSIGTLLGENKASNIYSWLRKNLQNSEDLLSIRLDPHELPYGFSTKISSVKSSWMQKLAKQVYEHLHEKSSESIYELSTALQDSLDSIFLDCDYWTCILLHLLGFPSDMYPAIISIPRVSGLMAHALESIDDADYKIFRPRQIYTGYEKRCIAVENLNRKSSALELVKEYSNSNAARRRTAAFDHVLLEELNVQIEETKAHISHLSSTLAETTGKSNAFRAIFKKQDSTDKELLTKTIKLGDVFKN
eukprot:NODE_362_length_10118_cov_0.149117.p2 type:complete len:522 gc:universal NODE_362_length_10118_cov_0.149117:7149-5584(-)